jgi:NADH dehydrogenase
VEDLVSALLWSLELEGTQNGTFEIGGPEYFTFRELVSIIMDAIGTRRFMIPMRQPYLRMGARLMERLFRKSPVTALWLDYLAVHRMADLETLPQVFGLQPARLEDCLGYLRRPRKAAWRAAAPASERGE